MTLDGKAFTLYGIREIVESFTDSPPLIETLLESTERAVVEESPITFELSKALIDTICKTILTDKGVEINRHWKTPQLFKNTQDQLSFMPVEHPDPKKFRSGMINILQGLESVI